VTQLFAATDLAKDKLGWVAEKSLNEMICSSWNWEHKLRNQNK
jgi:UDP-glucose 4-epimerase